MELVEIFIHDQKGLKILFLHNTDITHLLCPCTENLTSKFSVTDRVMREEYL
jgi:hypothetical protein